jgi:hypothetical protein
MPRYRKRPLVVDAIQWSGGATVPLDAFCPGEWARAEARGVRWLGPDDGERIVLWNMLEHCWICCPKGHWLIRGIVGEIHPCDPGVFARTYEAV